MWKASIWILQQWTQTLSSAPGLIPAERDREKLTRNSHSRWHIERLQLDGLIAFYNSIFLFKIAQIQDQAFPILTGQIGQAV